MRYVSLFSGVEAATVAWDRLGWQPLAFAEVDEFPCAVLAHRLPNVPNLGDVCDINWEEFHATHGAIDVLIGGSPCQSFSIAGSREGLQGESRLMFEYVRAVRDLVRASGGKSPRYIVWENVPGCLSSNKGRDFNCLLDALEECGYFVAWRTLDSQFARVFDRASGRFRGPVPQRRRRVYLVGSLGGPSAADILFERKSLLGDHPKGREAREALAEAADGRAPMGNCAGFKWYQGARARSIGYEDNVSPTLAVSDSHVPGVLLPFKTDHLSQNGRIYDEDGASFTLDTTNSNAVCFVQNRMGSQQGRAAVYEDVCPTVTSAAGTSGNNQPVVCMESAQTRAVITDDGSTPTLNASHEQPIIIDRAAFNQGENAQFAPHIDEEGVMDTLVARGPHAVCYRTETR